MEEYLNDMAPTLNINPGLVNCQKLNSLEVPQSPEKNFKSKENQIEIRFIFFVDLYLTRVGLIS